MFEQQIVITWKKGGKRKLELGIKINCSTVPSAVGEFTQCKVDSRYIRSSWKTDTLHSFVQARTDE